MKKKIFCLLLSIFMLVSAMPFSVFAGHRCPDCGEWIDGDPYCNECYRCESCSELCPGCSEVTGYDICVECAIDEGYHCPECDGCLVEAQIWCENCGKCDYCSPTCVNCALCEECAIDAEQHCPECGECYVDAQLWCQECGKCDDCCPTCVNCALCEECAIDAEQHCPECGGCYIDAQLWCEECGICNDCSPTCVNCALCEECGINAEQHCPECGGCYVDAQLWCENCGKCDDCCPTCVNCAICEECAIDAEQHCPDCGGCYIDAQIWCENCMRCCECVDICDYCSDDVGAFICVECAVGEGFHCPSCDECYGDCSYEYCSECGNCANCADICFDCVVDGICFDCAVEAGYHCPSCGECGENVAICENCEGCCSECASAFCENCSLCDGCALICPNCSCCSECESLCENCYEYCSGCADICGECGYCEDCCRAEAESEGCDCDEWVCIESLDWDDHYAEFHTDSPKTHTAKTSSKWEYDETNHWHKCLYCEESSHFGDKAKHSFDSTGKCKTCGYYKNSEIRIIEEPKDIINAYVSDANDDYTDNRVVFRVRAEGNGNLKYKWYRKYYVSNDKTVSYEITNSDVDKYFGSTIDVVVPTDACYYPPYYYCVITDGEGNSVTTREAKLNAKHVYKYFDYGHEPFENASCDENGHILQCCGEGCEAVTTRRSHCDEDGDYICDMCEYELEKVIKKINILYDEVYGAIKIGETRQETEYRLNNAIQSDYTLHPYLWFSTELCFDDNGTWRGISVSSAYNTVVKEGERYCVSIKIHGKLENGLSLPDRSTAEKYGFFCINGKAIPTSDFEIYRYYPKTDGSIDVTLHYYLPIMTGTQHNIKVENGEAVGVTHCRNKTAFEGQTVRIEIDGEYIPENGDVFLRWECVKGNVTFKNAKSGQTTFVMPDKDVEIRAVYGNPALKKAVYGDVNGDGKVKGNDATMLLKYLAGWNVTVDSNNADCNGDGKIKGNDATLLLKYLAGWDVKLG